MSEQLLARRGLSLERLESFCRVADAGGIAKAAAGDPARQSLYSRQVRELEAFFGVELIQRHGRGIQLTAAGKRLARLAREQFAALSDFQSESRGGSSPLTIGSSNSVMEWALAPRLPRLIEAATPAEIVLCHKRTAEIVRDLVDLKLDVGIVRTDALVPPLRRKPFLTMTYKLLVPQALVGQTTDAEIIERLDRFPMVLNAGESFRSHFMRAARRAGVRFRVAISCWSFTQAAKALATGRFVAVLPTIAVDARLREQCRVVEAPFLQQYERRLCVAWHPRLAALRPVIPAVVEVLKSVSAG
jgi:DNA-binding transcriptional LysR family regulator